MAIELSLSASDLDHEELHELTGQLCRDLLDGAGLEAEPAKEKPKPEPKAVKSSLPVKSCLKPSARLSRWSGRTATIWQTRGGGSKNIWLVCG